MKTLYVMRHAKSDWSGPEAADFDRPLNKRGRKDVPRMAGLLRNLAPTDDGAPAILSSPAARARETSEGVGALLEASIVYDERLYGAGPAVLSDVLSGLDPKRASCLVVAHNPGLEEWISHLCGARVRMATAATACLLLSIEDWSFLHDHCAHLEWLITPKLLKADAK